VQAGAKDNSDKVLGYRGTHGEPLH